VAAPIRVIAVRRLPEGKGSTKCFADVQIGGLVVKGFKVVCQEGQRPWLAPPATKNERAWLNIVEFASKPLQERVQQVVLEAWAEADQRQPAEVEP
jgi:DNA-binding cell septation regulator SpoVG